MLNESRLLVLDWTGIPISDSTLAKPHPCSNPKNDETTTGYFQVNVSCFDLRSSLASHIILRAIIDSTTDIFRDIRLRVVRTRVME